MSLGHQLNVLIIGQGGREHALAWKCLQSPRVEHIYVCPGNGGTATQERTTNVCIDPQDHEAIIAFCQQKTIPLVIIGPEAPLAAGLADRLQAANILCYGASQQAAQLESSKVFSKQFMRRHGIATADFQVFDQPEAALTYLSERQQWPTVIKASGLAAGKGVFIVHNLSEAETVLESVMVKKRFGDAGNECIIEDFIDGEELSVMLFSDGKTLLPMSSSRDYKRLGDQDSGPNTGGMGAYSPHRDIPEDLWHTVQQEIIERTASGLTAENLHYCGFLYIGVIIDANHRPYVLEYNCRLGDPETQVLLPRLQDDLIDVIDQAFQQQLHQLNLSWHDHPSLTVVLCSKGYPESSEKGVIIEGLDLTLPAHTLIFHAATTYEDGQYRTNGGRVLCITSMSSNLSLARNVVYEVAHQIHFDGMQQRHDIGA